MDDGAIDVDGIKVVDELAVGEGVKNVPVTEDLVINEDIDDRLRNTS